MAKKKHRRAKPVDAPYVEPIKEMLGDKHLSPDEAVVRETETALKQASQFALPGQRELEDPDRSSGARLYYTEVLRRLQSINPGIRVKDGIPGNIAIYVRKRNDEYDMEEWDPSHDTFFWHHRYVTGCPKSYLPEFSHVLLDTSHLPTREVRSWRSLLIALIKAGAVSYNEAIQSFSNPTGDQRCGRWFDHVGPWLRCPNSRFKIKTKFAGQ